MLNENIIIFGALLNAVGGLYYILQMVRGKVKPNRVTYFLWALAPLIAFFAEIQQHVGLVSLLTLSVGFIPLMVFLCSFINKKSYWAVTKLDIVCGIFSLVGLVLWISTRVGNIAIFFSILADGLAAFPTIIKSYRFPETENYIAYLFGAIAVVVTLLTIKEWNFANVGFPLYILICNMVITTCIILNPIKKSFLAFRESLNL